MASDVFSENIYSLVMDTSALVVFNATHYTQKPRGVLHTTIELFFFNIETNLPLQTFYHILKLTIHIICTIYYI